MGKLTYICLGVALVVHANAQSAANFNTHGVAPTAPVEKNPAPVAGRPVPKEPGPVSATASRNVDPSAMQEYLDSVSSIFLSKKRPTDPFGHMQDPDAKPVIKATVARNTNRPAAIQETPFSDIIGMIKINTIMPGEKKFLIGTRSIKQGDQIPVMFRNREIRVQVVEVTSRQINFRNLDTGETASHTLEMLPVGMTPGNSGITAPGMVPDLPNAPIQLDGN